MKTPALSLFTTAVLATSLPVSASAYQFQVAGTYRDGLFDESAAEIVAVDLPTKQLFVVNAGRNQVDVLDASDIFSPTFKSAMNLGSDWAPNSVAVHNGIVAVASGFAPASQAAGSVHFFSASSFDPLGQVTVGALPDMLTFTTDGKSVLVANEGEPNDAYTVDPEGAISIINIDGLNPLGGDDQVSQSSVTQLDFDAFNGSLSPAVRVFGPGATASQDLEPEYIAIGANGKAYVTLQENNALAVVDLASKTITDVLPLGFKDWSSGPELDAIRDDEMVAFGNLPIFGMYQPDAIASYEVAGQTYLVTANEGDARDYDAFSEEVRLRKVTLDTDAFTPEQIDMLQDKDGVGDLRITDQLGDTDGDGDLDEIYAYGGRSFSIWAADGSLVWDSGDMIEKLIAADPAVAPYFNASNDENVPDVDMDEPIIDDRSDDKGPEPEGVVIGEIDGRTFAFIGLERVGGIMMFDITDPLAPSFETYINNRDFLAEADSAEAGDLGPEGLLFIGAGNDLDPDGLPLLVVGNEVSGTTTIFRIVPEPASLALLALGGLTVLNRRRNA